MAKTKENFIKSPWAISIGTAIFSLILTIGYDFLKQKPILTSIRAILKWIVNLVWTVLNFDFKIWWIVIIVSLFFLIVVIIGKFKQEETFKPDFYSYREDKLKKWKWTWGWKFDDAKNVWIISEMKAHCPKCKTPMIEHSSRYDLRFDCPRCDFYAIKRDCDEPHKIERIILDNIDRQRAARKNSP
jgi:hypothetical protein